MLQEENERYRSDMELMDSTINGISTDSMHTDQQVNVRLFLKAGGRFGVGGGG